MDARADDGTTWVVAVDVGGTFTDVVAVNSRGDHFSLKLPSTPPDFQRAVGDGLGRGLQRAGVPGDAVRRVLHATTAGTNAVLSRTGPLTALVTTEGFRDVLEIGRLRTPGIYDLTWEKPVPLARRRHRVEAAERVSADGEVLVPLDPRELRAQLDALVDQGVRSVAVSFLNSYVNPEHEDRLVGWLRDTYPGLAVCAGSHVVAEIGEYERTSTAVLNAYLQPIMSSYVAALAAEFEGAGVGAPVFIMQSGGGMMPAAEAADLPVHLLESGPAAGVLAAADVAERAGVRQVISFDMGGTTAKASLVEDFVVARTESFAVGGEVSGANRLLRGGGYAVCLPTVDLAEVGAGGGSIASVDPAGGLSVGPISAGADPGPACYGRGGTRPTVTDANLVLGYISPGGLDNGGVQISRERAAAVIDEHVAGPLGLTTVEAAYAIHSVANDQMARVLRAVTTERGRAIADHSLLVFGGSGGIHAASLAESVGITSVLVPPFAGVLSAAGLLWAPVALTAVEASGTLLIGDVGGDLQVRLDQLAAGLRKRLSSIGDRMTVERWVDCCYAGQASELPIALDGGTPDADGVAAAFRRAHRRAYGHGGDDPVQAVRLRVTVSAEQEAGARPVAVADGPGGRGGSAGAREAYLRGAVRPVPVDGRAGLDRPRPGPLLVDDPDTSIVVPPGWTARLDDHANVRLERS